MSRAATARGIFGAALLLATWEVVARGFALPAYILPSVSSILASLWTERTLLLAAAAVTLTESIAGYAIGAIIGILLAALIAVLPPLRRTILPVALAINAVPVVAFSPLVLLWFGIGAASKVVMVALAVGFTVFLAALAGFDRTDRRTVDLLRSFGAGPWTVLWRLRLPAALPSIATGLRTSTVRALIVAIVTEMLGAYAGLGWIIYQAVVQIDFVRVWSAIAAASACSLAFFALVATLERRLVFWR